MQGLNNNSHRAHLSLYGMVFQTENIAKENERSPMCSIAVCRFIEKNGVCVGSSDAGVQWLYMQHVSDI